MSDISAPALWSCLDYCINYYVQILYFISLYSCPFHPMLWRRRFCALGHDHSLYCKPYIPTGCPKKRIFFHYQLSSQLALEGHVPSNPVSQNGNSESAFFGTPCISPWYTSALWHKLCEYDDFRSWHGLLEGHDDVDEEKMKMSMVMRLTSPIGILAKAYLPSLAIAALLLRRRRKTYFLPGLSNSLFVYNWPTIF